MTKLTSFPQSRQRLRGDNLHPS